MRPRGYTLRAGFDQKKVCVNRTVPDNAIRLPGSRWQVGYRAGREWGDDPPVPCPSKTERLWADCHNFTSSGKVSPEHVG
jgi:hypothetical protein